MRRFLLLVSFCLLLIPAAAQESASFTCDEETTHTTQFSLMLPEIGSNASQVIASVLGMNTFEPVLQLHTQELDYCATVSAYYALEQAGEPLFTPEAISVQDAAVFPGSTQLFIGEQNDQPGTFYLVLEAGFEPGTTGDHVYHTTIREELAENSAVLDVYLFALTDEGTPAFTIRNGETSADSAMQDDLLLDSAFGLRESGAMASVAPQVGELSIAVPRQENMLYALLLAVTTGTPQIGDGSAAATVSDEGAATLLCDDQLIYENGVHVGMPDDEQAYQVTLLGVGDVDPVLALVDEDGAGVCYDNQPETLTMRLELPSVTVNGSPVSALGVAEAATRNIIAGAHESAAGSYVLLIAGGTLNENEAADFVFTISPGMVSAYDFLTIYAVAIDNELDPALVLLDENGAALSSFDGSTMICDNAGQEDSCPQGTTGLRGSYLPLADGNSLYALELDAMLALPIDPDMQAKPIGIRVNAVEGSGGYLLALHIVTD